MTAEPTLIELRRALGSDAVLTDGDLLDRYAHDESEVPRQRPAAVVRARSTAEVATVLRVAHAHGTPVVPRGGGTGRVGGCVPVPGAIVLAFERMDAVKGIEGGDLVAVAQPGVVLAELHRAVEAEGLFYGPDANSLESCVLGGNIGTNAGGPRTLKYGPTRDWILGLEVVTADGTVLQVGKRTPKGVTGYDVTSLLVGSEGTLAVVTEATVKLVPAPEGVVTMLVFVPDMPAAGRAVGAAFEAHILPRCVELLDPAALQIVKPQAGVPVPEGARAMLLVELDGPEQVLAQQLERCGQAMMAAGAVEVLVAKDAAERRRLWTARRDLSHALRRTAGNKLSEDVVVPRTRIPALLDHCAQLAETHGVRMPTYGHAGDGNLHVNFLWDDPGQRPAVDRAIRGLLEKVVALGGTLTGEHGIGVLKAPYLPLEQAEPLIALQERLKRTFDPHGILNPGKIFPAHAARHFHGPC
ncbi:MAG: FAD-binding oxidoreductase [Myxococcota bacterium]